MSEINISSLCSQISDFHCISFPPALPKLGWTAVVQSLAIQNDDLRVPTSQYLMPRQSENTPLHATAHIYGCEKASGELKYQISVYYIERQVH
jgi:hypothetical protein